MPDPSSATFISLTLPQLLTLIGGTLATVFGGGAVGYRKLSSQQSTVEIPSPACPLNGRLAVVADNYAEMNDNLRELKDAMIEFSVSVRKDHQQQHESCVQQIRILQETSNILAVVSSHVVK